MRVSFCRCRRRASRAGSKRRVRERGGRRGARARARDFAQRNRPNPTGTAASPLLFFVTTSGLLCCYSCNGPTPLQPTAPTALPSPQSLVHNASSQASGALPFSAAKPSAAYPPTAAKAPSALPFGTAAAKPAAGASYPPTAAKAPSALPFGTAAAKPAAGASYPPTATKAPSASVRYGGSEAGGGRLVSADGDQGAGASVQYGGSEAGGGRLVSADGDQGAERALSVRRQRSRRRAPHPPTANKAPSALPFGTAAATPAAGASYPPTANKAPSALLSVRRQRSRRRAPRIRRRRPRRRALPFRYGGSGRRRAPRIRRRRPRRRARFLSVRRQRSRRRAPRIRRRRTRRRARFRSVRRQRSRRRAPRIRRRRPRRRARFRSVRRQRSRRRAPRIRPAATKAPSALPFGTGGSEAGGGRLVSADGDQGAKRDPHWLWGGSGENASSRSSSTQGRGRFLSGPRSRSIARTCRSSQIASSIRRYHTKPLRSSTVDSHQRFSQEAARPRPITRRGG